MDEFRQTEEAQPAEGPKKQEFWTYGRLALLGLALAVVVVVATTSRRPAKATRGGAPASPSAPASVMEASIQSLDGDPFRLADYKGKIVVLDLWATWCGPCRLEIPHLVKISDDYRDRGVEVIGLSVENPASAEATVRDFAREYKINYKLGWARDDWFLAMTRGHGAIPQTFVIDREGRIRLHAPGYSPNLPNIIRDAIEKADKGQG